MKTTNQILVSLLITITLVTASEARNAQACYPAPPHISWPQDGAKDIPLNSPIVIRNVSSGMESRTSLTLKDSGGNEVPVTFTEYNDLHDKNTYLPSAQLRENSTYTVNMEIEDYVEETVSFTTGTSVDVEAPSIFNPRISKISYTPPNVTDCGPAIPIITLSISGTFSDDTDGLITTELFFAKAGSEFDWESPESFLSNPTADQYSVAAVVKDLYGHSSCALVANFQGLDADGEVETDIAFEKSDICFPDTAIVQEEPPTSVNALANVGCQLSAKTTRAGGHWAWWFLVLQGTLLAFRHKIIKQRKVQS